MRYRKFFQKQAARSFQRRRSRLTNRGLANFCAGSDFCAAFFGLDSDVICDPFLCSCRVRITFSGPGASAAAIFAFVFLLQGSLPSYRCIAFGYLPCGFPFLLVEPFSALLRDVLTNPSPCSTVALFKTTDQATDRRTRRAGRRVLLTVCAFTNAGTGRWLCGSPCRRVFQMFSAHFAVPGGCRSPGGSAFRIFRSPHNFPRRSHSFSWRYISDSP